MDLEFGGSNNGSNSSNFYFNAALGLGVSSTPPGPAKDNFDKKYVYSIQSIANGKGHSWTCTKPLTGHP